MVIFLAGAHGAGKTFLGKPAADSLGITYVTASALIREELGAVNWSNEKRVLNVDRNQEALISAVSSINRISSQVVLDGHFVLRNEMGDVIALPLNVFKRLKIKAVILLEAPANIISLRLAARGASQSLAEVEEIASAELGHAQLICRELRIPLVRLLSPTEAELRETLVEMGKI